MRFAGTIAYRPVRVAFLIPPDDLHLFSRVAQISTCLWGGRYNPIIPFFESGGDRWNKFGRSRIALDITRDYIDFFEPDLLVEAEPGMAEKLGWQNKSHYTGLPRVISLENVYKLDHYGRVNFEIGIDINEVMFDQYDKEFKYQRRHKETYSIFKGRDAFFDVAGGRYPPDADLEYLSKNYSEVFDSQGVKSNASTALRLLKGELAGPLWVTRHRLEETVGNSRSDQTFCIVNSSDPGDLIDYWNFRLVEPRSRPVNVKWLATLKSYLRSKITKMHHPIPGNPFGTRYHSTLQFGNSISDAQRDQILQEHFGDLPRGSYWIDRYESPGPRAASRHMWHATKVVAAGTTTSFDEEVSADGYVKLPAPAPEFLNATRMYATSRWVNLIVPSSNGRENGAATVYPSNIWSPDFPRLGIDDQFRISREGWALYQEHSIGYLLLRPQSGRDAIVGWLKSHGLSAVPSEEGQIAHQIIATAGSLLACGMFADLGTVKLLNQMAEGHTETSRHGRRVQVTTPASAKHIQTVSQHFTQRAKRSFGFWNTLQYFLEKSVFRAGLRVQCPTCSYHNWIDLNGMSYTPTCSRCLKSFSFSQAPENLSKTDWYYRVIGPFAAPDYARGSYAVALSLRCLSAHHDTEISWSTGLKIEDMRCEVDFIAWHRPSGFLREESTEPTLLFGEAKSFGHNAIGDDVVQSLKTFAERFSGAVMVVSSLREISEYAPEELERLRDLAIWGRSRWHQGHPRNPLIILTGTELFSDHNIFEKWEEKDRLHSYRFNLRTIAELTQQRYLGLPPFWETLPRAPDLTIRRQNLRKLITSPHRRIIELIQSRQRAP